VTSSTGAATRLLERLEGVKPTGSNKWQARCPAHDDKTPSLGLTQVEGQLLIHCFAGCQSRDVLASLNLTESALFDNPKGAQYDYRNSAGVTVRTVFRGPEKKFSQKVIDNNTVPLFRLDRVTAAVAFGRPVYITEGEKDTLAAESLGVTATTAPMGAANWNKADYEPLRGAAHVVIVADLDDAGRKRAAGLQAHLESFGIGALSVVGPAIGKDLADHIAAGHSVAELVPYNVTTVPAVDVQPREKYLKLTRASDIEATCVTWLFKDLVPNKTLTVVAGPSGIGKTTLVSLFLAQITMGTLPGDFFGQPKDVLIISPEDDPAAVTRPRLEAAGADLDRVHFVSVTRRTATGEVESVATFPTDIEILREAVIATNPVAILLDPIASLIDGNLDKREDIRAAFDRLSGEIANRFNLAVILIAHNKKGYDSVRSKVSGSTAITDAARSVLALGRDDETEQIILSVDKSSYSVAEGTNHAYALMTTSVPLVSGGTTDVARAVYIGETTTSVAELNERQAGADDDHEDRNAAQAFVLDYIKSCPELEAPAKDVLKAGHAAGFSETEIKNARSRCKSPRIASGRSAFSGGWVWAITTQGITESPQGIGGITRTRADTLDSLGTNSDALGAAKTPTITTTADTCTVHGTPTYQGMCGRCEAGK
jgi:hypothetical protein